MSNIDDKELILIRSALAKQEVNEKNITAIKDFAVSTRAEFRELQALVNGLKNTIEGLTIKNNQLEQQVRALQVRLFSGGSTV